MTITTQNNSWFERGEFPPVGTVCEVKTKTFKEWIKCFVVGKSSCGYAVIECYGYAFIIDSTHYFRPLRTEREMAIEDMSNIMHSVESQEGLINDLALGALYDAGYRKQ